MYYSVTRASHGVKIEVHPGEPIDSIVRRFKKAVLKAEILTDVRKREHFIPKSERRRLKSLRARRRRSP